MLAFQFYVFLVPRIFKANIFKSIAKVLMSAEVYNDDEDEEGEILNFLLQIS